MKSKVAWLRLMLTFGLLLALFQTSLAFKVSQIEFHLSIPSGESDTFTFTVENDEAEATTVNVSLADWDRSISGENRFLEPGTLSRSSAGWISVSPTQFELGPDEAKEVRFTINVPEGVEGTYWAMILVEGSPKQVEIGEGTTVIVRKRFGIKVYETPPGTAEKDGQITDMELLGKEPLTIMVEFENTGNANLDVEGEVEIVDQTGTTVETMKIESFPILPEGKRRLEVTSQAEQLPPGRYRAIAKLDFGGEFMIGKVLDFEIEG